MAYLNSRRRPSMGSMAAVVAIHGAVGAALVLGLTVTGVITPEPPRLTTIPYREPPPPPPVPEPTVEPSPAASTDPYVPPVPIPMPRPAPTMDTTDRLPPPMPPRPQPGPSQGPTAAPEPLPSVKPSFAPQAARPRSDPKSWVTVEDYRGSWIRQELTGKARFRLDIAADGRVTGCTITASSGHAALDQATCALVSKRARFQPARGSEGEPVAGSYSNAIDWQLPD